MSSKGMKVFGIVFVVLGVLWTLLPFHIAPVCTKLMANGMPMPCKQTGRIEVILACVLIALGVLVFFIGNRGVQRILGLLAGIAGLLGIAFPLFITGGCKSPMMACHVHAFPALYLISGLVLVLAIIHVFVSGRHAV